MPSKYDINSISNLNDKDVTIFESEQSICLHKVWWLL